MCYMWYLPSLYKFYKFGHRMPVPADSSDAIGRRMPGAGVPVRRMPGRRRVRVVERRRSDAIERRLPLCRRSDFGWPKPLHVARPPPL